MSCSIEEVSPEKLVVTMKSRPTPRDYLPYGFYMAVVFADEIRRHRYVFVAVVLAIVATLTVYAINAGEELVLSANRLKHRIPLLGFRMLNQSFAADQIRRLRYEIRRRSWFPDQAGLRFLYKGRNYRIGEQISPEEASQIIDALKVRFPQITSEESN
jgi:hypothetical protein